LPINHSSIIKIQRPSISGVRVFVVLDHGSKESAQGQEVLVRFFPHCLGRYSPGKPNSNYYTVPNHNVIFYSFNLRNCGYGCGCRGT
jgi:hypothetical protein